MHSIQRAVMNNGKHGNVRVRKHVNNVCFLRNSKISISNNNLLEISFSSSASHQLLAPLQPQPPPKPSASWNFQRVKTCAFCEKDHSLAICFEHDYFICHRCGTSGNLGLYEEKLKLSKNQYAKDDYEMTKKRVLHNQSLGNNHSATISGLPRYYSTGANLAAAASSSIPATTTTMISNSVESGLTAEEITLLEQPSKNLIKEWSLEQGSTELSSPVVKFLQNRGLKRETCLLYKVGADKMRFRDPAKPEIAVTADVVTFPFYHRFGEFDPQYKPSNSKTALVQEEPTIRRYKARGVENKRLMRSLPKGQNAQTFFGWHTVPLQAKEIVITEGEIDAMTVYQECKIPAVSVPNGANAFPDTLLQVLGRFEKVILWFDDDSAGRDGCDKAVEKISAKFGDAKCLIVRPTEKERLACKKNIAAATTANSSLSPKLASPPPKDANDFLMQGYDVSKLLACKRPLKHKKLMSFHDIFDDVRESFKNPEKKVGRQFVGFPTLNHILGGHRLGEMTIISGPTGSGKTTLLSQLSLDLCMNGVPTLWGSFEIDVVRLNQIMMQQFIYREVFSGWVPPPSSSNNPSNGSSSSDFIMPDLANDEVFDFYAEEFGNRVPVQFMNFFGSTDVSEVIDVMKNAVQVQDVRHVIIDNLQYMVSGAGLGPNWGKTNTAYSNLNKFETMEKALDQFRAFATNQKIHLSIVVHPRKVPENSMLTIDSIMGTAKASQEADNVMVIQKTESGKKLLDVKKNRYLGSLGKMQLGFEPRMKCFFDQGLAPSLSDPFPSSSSSSNHSFASSSFAATSASFISSSPSINNGTSDGISSLKFPQFSSNEDEALLQATADCVDGNENEVFEKLQVEMLPHRDVEVLKARYNQLKFPQQPSRLQSPIRKVKRSDI
jgi:archaellum biogenesis ATPase FlaH